MDKFTRSRYEERSGAKQFTLQFCFHCWNILRILSDCWILLCAFHLKPILLARQCLMSSAIGTSLSEPTRILESTETEVSVASSGKLAPARIWGARKTELTKITFFSHRINLFRISQPIFVSTFSLGQKCTETFASMPLGNSGSVHYSGLSIRLCLLKIGERNMKNNMKNNRDNTNNLLRRKN